MSLSEIEFAFFLPAALLVYWLLPRRSALQNGLLLLASYGFYATWSLQFLGLLCASTGADYLIARRLEATGADAGGARRRLLLLSLVINLGALAYFKYQGFFAENLNTLLTSIGLRPSLPILHLALPLGISFYTLQKLGYIIDVHDGRQPACRSFVTFATFVAFFPQLTAGPISRGHQLLPQLERARMPQPGMLASGAATVLLGFGLKAFVADTLGANLVDPVFAGAGSFTAGVHWLGLLGYAAQVFADFGGYSIIAIGVGRLFGIELPVNFNFPFLSRSVVEFWRRWHITLNTWLFDYIYGPLVTSRGWWRNRLDAGFLAVFLLSGLWHGPRWTFILWGAIHGVALIVHRRWDEFYRGLCRRDRRWVQRRKLPAYAAAAWFLTQGVFVLSLIPFRSPSLGAAGAFARGLLAGGDRPLDASPLALATLVASAAALFLYYLVGGTHPGLRWWERFQALPSPVRGLAYGIVLVLLTMLTPIAGGQFIYAQF